ncbi:FecR domain-containing protein [Paraliomyxa miuraensis]|uniref:FecR domain-containing protein n=1 Tax=Paraliomyxa miuraensis TaxID=376150 RepID=UPI00225B9F23|nr:FecR domain-containing protein [Paraliomyxa miuraensis]MCX4246450.1 FecR family protein [Paraliomyxa miuraensis]
MSERPRLAPSLRELDEVLAERGMPRHARDRVGARLRREALRREATSGFRFRWLPALTFAAGAALVLMVVGVRLRQPPPISSQTASSTPTVFGGSFSVQGESCRHVDRGPEVELRGTCLLSAPHLAVHTWDRVRLRHDRADHESPGDVRLVEGTAMFDVTRVVEGAPPTRIPVSHGVIEVLGTRFTIEQGPLGGHVDLFEGRIRFIDLEGVVTEIAPGQRHAWGDAVAMLSPAPNEDAESLAPGGSRTPAVAATATATVVTTERDAASEADHAGEPDRDVHPPRRRSARAEPRAAEDDDDAVATADDATALIDEVGRLRAQGRYGDAAEVLRRAERTRHWDARTAQVLSYELGEIIERHLGDRQAACEHWARHAERWPQGRYARAVKAAQERLACPNQQNDQ